MTKAVLLSLVDGHARRQLFTEPDLHDALERSLPTFFFHIRSGEIVVMDDDGVTVASPQEAVLHGYQIARDLALKEGVGERFLDSVAVEVLDERDVIWARIPLRNANPKHPFQSPDN